MATKWDFSSLLDNQKDTFDCYVSSVLCLIEEHEIKSLWHSVDVEVRENHRRKQLFLRRKIYFDVNNLFFLNIFFSKEKN